MQTGPRIFAMVMCSTTQHQRFREGSSATSCRRPTDQQGRTFRCVDPESIVKTPSPRRPIWLIETAASELSLRFHSARAFNEKCRTTALGFEHQFDSAGAGSAGTNAGQTERGAQVSTNPWLGEWRPSSHSAPSLPPPPQLATLLDEVAALPDDPTFALLSPEARVAWLQNLRKLIDVTESVFLRCLGDFDAQGDAQTLNAATTTAGWLRTCVGLAPGDANERVRIARGSNITSKRRLTPCRLAR